MNDRRANAIGYRPRLHRLLVVLVLALVAGTAQAAPKAELWGRWTAHDPASKVIIDHAPWDRFLDAYLVMDEDGVNRLAYGHVAEPDRQTLSAYIDRLAATPISGYNRREQLAYWINLYNALTVRLVLDHYPLDSILDLNISPGLFSVGPWRKKLVRVEGEALSLDDIEHRILRPIWRDPRIHYAVNCASVGCPNLQRDAFTGANAERLLTAGAHEYVNHPRGVSFYEGDMFASSIYKWFKEDFGGSDAGVIAHLRAYAEARLRDRLARVRDISGYVYDWSLNGVAPAS